MSTSTPTAKYLEVLHGKSMENLLRDLYDEQRMSQEDVAAALGVSRWTVMKWMADCGIPTRDRRRVA